MLISKLKIQLSNDETKFKTHGKKRKKNVDF